MPARFNRRFGKDISKQRLEAFIDQTWRGAWRRVAGRRLIKRAAGGPQRGIHAPLVKQPLPAGFSRRLYVMEQRGAQHIAAAHVRESWRRIIEPGKPEGFQGCIEVGSRDAAGGMQCSALHLVHPRPRTGDVRGFGKRLREGQMLQAMQGVVVHEIADRRLRRQHVLKMVQPASNPLVQRERLLVGRVSGGGGLHLSHRTDGKFHGPRPPTVPAAAPGRSRRRQCRSPAPVLPDIHCDQDPAVGRGALARQGRAGR